MAGDEAKEDLEELTDILLDFKRRKIKKKAAIRRMKKIGFMEHVAEAFLYDYKPSDRNGQIKGKIAYNLSDIAGRKLENATERDARLKRERLQAETKQGISDQQEES